MAQFFERRTGPSYFMGTKFDLVAQFVLLVSFRNLDDLVSLEPPAKYYLDLNCAVALLCHGVRRR